MRGSVTISKIIIDEEGNEVTENLPEDEFTFQITLRDPDGNEITGKTEEDDDAIWYKLLKNDGTEAAAATVINSGDTFTLKAGHSLRLINVPLGVTYDVEEVQADIPSGYAWSATTYTYVDEDHPTATTQSTNEDGYYEVSANTWHYVTVKNEIKPQTVIFDILKVRQGTTTPLEGASFTIRQIKENSTTSSVQPMDGQEASEPVTTGENGMVSFTEIEPGFYEVTETVLPKGYVFTGDESFYIKVANGEVKLLEKKVVNGKLTFTEAQTATVGNVTISDSGTTVLFTVENVPGAALPNTGGPGTRIFTILGSILIFFASLLLIRNKKAA